MNAIVPFTFESRPVRISDRDGQPWFALSDVCAVLEIGNVGNAAARLDDDEKGSIRNPDVTPTGGNPNLTVINESGLYKLVLRSRKEGAKRFTKWITSEVLPSIRRTGQYGTPAPALDLSDTATLHRLLLEHTGKTLAADERVAQLEPKAEALDRLALAEGDLCITDAAKALGVQPRRLFAWLEAQRWIYRRSDGGHFVAFSEKINAKLVDHRGTSLRRPGKPDKWVEQVVVTPKGLARLAELKAGQ